jgi:hypothetical protein
MTEQIYRLADCIHNRYNVFKFTLNSIFIGIGTSTAPSAVDGIYSKPLLKFWNNGISASVICGAAMN